MRTTRIYKFLFIAAMVTSCSGKRNSHKNLDDPRRGGDTLEAISFRYADSRPSVSTDGTKIVFVSGRDSTDLTATSKAYKATWAEGGEPGEVARVTPDDSVGIERSALISPDGKWVLIQSANGASTDLYLQDYASASAPVRITEDAALESQPSFSPDGKLIVWVSNDKAKATTTAKLVEIGDGTAATLAKQTVLTTEEQTVKQTFWLPATPGYKLAIATAIASSNASAFAQRTFTDFDGAATATDVAWIESYVTDPNLTPASAGDNVLFGHRLLSTDGFVVSKIGTEAETGNLQTTVSSEPAWLSPAPGSAVQRYSNIPGFQTLGLGVSSDGLTNFFLERHFYRCRDQGYDSYGSAFVIAPTDPAGAFTRILPRLDSDHVHFLASANFCELKADNNPAWVDDKIAEMALAGNATSTKFRILYTTRFTTKFNKDCILRSSDTEVMALEFADGTARFYPLSKNPAPIEDADRKGNPACAL